MIPAARYARSAAVRVAEGSAGPRRPPPASAEPVIVTARLRTDAESVCTKADEASSRTHRARQRIADQAIGQHTIERYFEAIARLRVARAIPVTLLGDQADLTLGQAVPLHMPARAHRAQIDKRTSPGRVLELTAALTSQAPALLQPSVAVEVIDPRTKALEHFGAVHAGEMQLLDTHDKRNMCLPTEDLRPGAV